jgi:hypothetical protein
MKASVLLAVFLLLCVTAIVPSALADPLIAVTAHVTADNHYVLYFGSADGTDLTFVGRNEFGILGNPGIFNWSLPETWTFEMDKRDYIYVVAWNTEPDGYRMLIGDFVGPKDTLVTNAPLWESYAIQATAPGDLGTPALDFVQTEIASAMWSEPGAQLPLGILWLDPVTGLGIQGVDPMAQHIWHDEFWNGSNYAIFRAPVEYLAHKHDAIPEPSSFSLLAIGILGLIGYRSRKKTGR